MAARQWHTLDAGAVHAGHTIKVGPLAFRVVSAIKHDVTANGDTLRGWLVSFHLDGLSHPVTVHHKTLMKVDIS